MATAEEYANWIVQNQDKKGTPEFETVTAAYKIARSQSEEKKPQGGLMQDVGNLAAGALRGAGSIGATLLAPVDVASDVLAGKGLSLESNRQRRAAMDAALQSMGADPEAGMYALGKTAAEIAGTAGIGGPISQGVQAAGKAIPVLSNTARRLAPAIESAGFNVGPAATTMTGKLGNAALRLAGGATVGGAATGMVNPEDAAMGAGVGAAFGAVSPLAEKAISPLAKLLRKPDASKQSAMAFNAADDAINRAAQDLGISPNQIPADTKQYLMQQVMQAFKQGKQIDPAALLREQDFKALGINPLQGQITRDPAQFAMERNLRGVSPEIQGRLTEQNAALQRVFGQPAAAAEEQVSAGRGMIEALRQQDEASRAGISALYKQARESAGKDLELPMQGLAQDFANTLDSFGDKVPSGVRNQFKKFGLDGGTQSKLYTVEEADKLLKVINANQSNDPAVNAALSQLRNAVKNSVLQVDESGGVFAPAVKAAKERFAALDKNPALKAVAEGGAIPDNFVDKFLVKGRSDEVKALAEALKNSPDQFSQAKAQIAEDIRRAAFGENIAGDSALRPEMLAKKLRDLGTEKMRAFFSPEEMERYNTALRVASYIEKHPNAAPVNTSNTLVAQLMTNPALHVAGKVAESIPGAGIAINTAKAATGAVKNQMAVSKAMNAKVPVEKLGLNEDQRRLLVKALGATGAGGSVALANKGD